MRFARRLLGPFAAQMRPKWGLMVARYGYSDWDGFKPTPWLWFEPAAKFGERGRIWPPANCASLS